MNCDVWKRGYNRRLVCKASISEDWKNTWTIYACVMRSNLASSQRTFLGSTVVGRHSFRNFRTRHFDQVWRAGRLQAKLRPWSAQAGWWGSPGAGTLGTWRTLRYGHLELRRWLEEMGKSCLRWWSGIWGLLSEWWSCRIVLEVIKWWTQFLYAPA